MPLRRRDVTPSTSLTVVDIGARGGAHPRWKHDRVILVEPDQAARADLDGDVIPVALADYEGTALLNIARSGGDSSLLRPNMGLLARFPNMERFETVRQMEVKVDTLDDQLASLGVRPDVLKLDVQGGELAVLRGALATLPSVVAIEIEVEFQPLYEGQALFGDIDAELRMHGFELFDVCPVWWRRQNGALGRGQIIFGDALYLRPPETNPGLHPQLLAVAHRYHLDDLVELLGGSRRARRRPRGSSRLSRPLLRAGEWLRPTQPGFVHRDRRLGQGDGAG